MTFLIHINDSDYATADGLADEIFELLSGELDIVSVKPWSQHANAQQVPTDAPSLLDQLTKLQR